MNQEIERKFLVDGDFRKDVHSSSRIAQGYICSAPGRTVRIRIRDSKGYITIKGAADASGISRFEWEREIPLEDAERLLELSEPGIIDKTRFLAGNTDGIHTWEIDEFHGDNEGLVVAEIELGSVDDSFDRPEWLGKEVSDDRRYFNSSLSKHPYKEWNQEHE